MMNTDPVPEADIELIKKFEDKSRKPVNGYIVDYFGSKININFASHLHPRDEVLDLPIPSDGIFHEFIEYLGTAFAIDTASGDSITVIELGAGFGPWIVRSAIMSRKKDVKEITLVGVEADHQHFEWMKQHFNANDLTSTISSGLKIDLFNSAISETDKFLYFPEIGKDREDWGAAASSSTSNYDYRGLEVTLKKIPAIPINELLSKYKNVDLLHIDIQGSEFGVIQCGMDQLNEKARVMVIGTHSRKIEGDLLELLFHNKWILRNEKPCSFVFNQSARSLEGMTSVDGTQIWVNSRF